MGNKPDLPDERHYHAYSQNRYVHKPRDYSCAIALVEYSFKELSLTNGLSRVSHFFTFVEGARESSGPAPYVML